MSDQLQNKVVFYPKIEDAQPIAGWCKGDFTVNLSPGESQELRSDIADSIQRVYKFLVLMDEKSIKKAEDLMSESEITDNSDQSKDVAKPLASKEPKKRGRRRVRR